MTVEHASPSKLDLNAVVAQHPNLSLQIGPTETVEERQQRLSEQRADNRVARYKDAAIFMTLLIALAVTFGLAVWLLVSSAPAEEKRWATSILSAVVAGGIGYVTGKGSAKAVAR